MKIVNLSFHDATTTNDRAYGRLLLVANSKTEPKFQWHIDRKDGSSVYQVYYPGEEVAADTFWPIYFNNLENAITFCENEEVNNQAEVSFYAQDKHEKDLHQDSRSAIITAVAVIVVMAAIFFSGFWLLSK